MNTTTENTLVENEVENTETLVENTETKIDRRHDNKGRGKKTRNIMPINLAVYAGFSESFDNSTSFSQYNVTVGEFTERMANKGVYNLLAKDIEAFLTDFAKTESKMKSAKIHLSAFYRWMLNNGFEDKLQRSVLIWLAK